MTEHTLDLEGLEFRVVDEGEGFPVVLIHGFPDSATLWRNQIPALVDAGFRAIAPDLRGFGESAKPETVEQYAIPLILSDVRGILDSLRIEKAHLIGHDWGSAVAWIYTVFDAPRIDKLVAISVGHPAAFRGGGMDQRAASWYMYVFQFRGIAEELLKQNDWRWFREWIDWLGGGDMERYVEDLSRPGALTAALNWYRANAPPESLLADQVALPPVEVPTLGIWSTGDRALTENQMIESSKYVSSDWRYERFEGCGHWVPLQRPEELNSLLLEFLNPRDTEQPPLQSP